PGTRSPSTPRADSDRQLDGRGRRTCARCLAALGQRQPCRRTELLRLLRVRGIAAIGRTAIIQGWRLREDRCSEGSLIKDLVVTGRQSVSSRARFPCTPTPASRYRA